MADERERQTSNKAGLKSLGKKMDRNRHGFAEHPASRKTAGAFAHEERTDGRSRESARGSTRRSKQVPLSRMKKNT